MSLPTAAPRQYAVMHRTVLRSLVVRKAQQRQCNKLVHAKGVLTIILWVPLQFVRRSCDTKPPPPNQCDARSYGNSDSVCKNRFQLWSPGECDAAWCHILGWAVFFTVMESRLACFMCCRSSDNSDYWGHRVLLQSYSLLIPRLVHNFSSTTSMNGRCHENVHVSLFHRLPWVVTSAHGFSRWPVYTIYEIK